MLTNISKMSYTVLSDNLSFLGDYRFEKTKFVQAVCLKHVCRSLHFPCVCVCVCFWHLAEKPCFAKAGLLNGVVLSNKQLVNLA